MEKKIRRLRVIPPKYLKVDVDINPRPDAGALFLRLFQMFGKPYEKGEEIKYLVKNRDIVAEIHICGDFLAVWVYISPTLQNVIEKKSIKVVNILARDINKKGVAYCGDYEDSLYYAVRKRNDILKERFIEQYGEDRERMRRERDAAIGEAGRKKIAAPITDYAPEITDRLNEIFYGSVE